MPTLTEQAVIGYAVPVKSLAFDMNGKAITGVESASGLIGTPEFIFDVRGAATMCLQVTIVSTTGGGRPDPSAWAIQVSLDGRTFFDPLGGLPSNNSPALFTPLNVSAYAYARVFVGTPSAWTSEINDLCVLLSPWQIQV